MTPVLIKTSLARLERIESIFSRVGFPMGAEMRRYRLDNLKTQSTDDSAQR